MPPPGSTTYRLRFAVVAAALAVVVAAAVWTLIRSADDSSSATATATANAATSSPEGHRVVKDSEVLASKSLGRAKHTAATSPLPPPDTSLAQIYDELKARADTGDVAAASRLYETVQQCLTVVGNVVALQTMLDQYGSQDTRGQNAEELARREKTIASMQRQLAQDSAIEAGVCAGVSPTQLQIMPAALRAAQLGDDAAANCYVGMPMAYAHGLIDHPEWLAQYKQQALTLADAAISRGDWTMVVQLQHAYAEPFYADGGLLHQLTGTDLAIAYRYTKLLRLGTERATDISVSFLDQQLIHAYQTLPESVIRAGDAWADDVYKRDFNSNPDSPGLSEMSVCEMPHG
jgi:hypothetical protein